MLRQNMPDGQEHHSEAPPVTFEEVFSRLSQTDPTVLALVYGEVIRQLKFEHDIRERIEKKAQAALSVGGLAITLSTGMILKVALDVAEAPIWFPQWMSPAITVSILALPLIAGVVTTALALIGLRIAKDTKQADYRDVFSVDALKNEGTWYRWMTAHVFSVAEAQQTANDRRSFWVRASLRAFTVFLAIVAMLGILMSGHMVYLGLMTDKKSDSNAEQKPPLPPPAPAPMPTKGGRDVQSEHKGGKLE